MASIDVPCRYCNQTTPVRKHGTLPNGKRRFLCTACRKTFQLDYSYEASKPGVKDKITEMAMNNAGIRDTARVLGVGTNTVLRTLKSSRQGK